MNEWMNEWMKLNVQYEGHMFAPSRDTAGYNFEGHLVSLMTAVARF